MLGYIHRFALRFVLELVELVPELESAHSGYGGVPAILHSMRNGGEELMANAEKRGAQKGI